MFNPLDLSWKPNPNGIGQITDPVYDTGLDMLDDAVVFTRPCPDGPILGFDVDGNQIYPAFVATEGVCG